MVKVETVAEHCKHKDCVYRCDISGGTICGYILYEGEPRRCAISKCDKYRQKSAGRKPRSMAMSLFTERGANEV